MLQPVKVVEQLRKEQGKILLDDALEILKDSEEKDQNIINSIRTSKGLNNSVPDQDKIELFSIEAIHKICCDYRLRFLPGKYYKGEIPYEALIRVKDLERRTGRELKEFMIIAPADFFSLKDEYEDPVLLAPLGNGRYLFIHQWGNDLSRFRKLLYYPLRSFETYIKSIALLTLILTMLVPSDWLVTKESLYESSGFYYRMMFFGCCLTWIFVITFYYGFVSRKNFSSSDWNNKYL